MALERVTVALTRSARRLYFRGVSYRPGRRDYLFVSGPGGDARRYRCDHQAEQLRHAGSSADVGFHDELDLAQLAPRYRTIVLYRVPWDAKVERLLAAASARDTRVVADIDDLVFDRPRIRLIDGIVAQGPEVQRAAEDRAQRLAQTLRAVERAVVSTAPLREAVTPLNEKVVVAHNAVSARMVHMAQRARRRKSRTVEGAVVAYLSGTATHDRDFLEAADALLWALERYRSLRFWSIGYLRIDDRFDRYADRIVRIPYRTWRRLPQILAVIDISLAPLERDNDFTDAKSCLKYLEAGIMGVPTIATPTSDFRRAIEHDANGLLANDPDDWREAIGRLVESRELRERLGNAALDDVVTRHTTVKRARETAVAFAASEPNLVR